ncbi:MAG: ADP-ribosylglycohydrolase family protein [Xanthomonadales bacterium]|jgi:ADP-ribosylglycohydrolase|nr:ADP-ribosylglycohydrolase family protein [Xanthomonadales bacterium]
MTCNDRIDGGLFGLLLGDAIGVPSNSTRRTRLGPSTRSTVAIALGHDTDTTAAIAGGLAGLKFGLAGIPEPWCAALRGQHWVRPLLDRLLFPIDEATP